MRKFFIAVLVFCLAAAPALALAEGTLKVTGSAKLTISPDQATLSLGYTCEDTVSAVARTMAAEASAAILAAVKAAGVAEDEIATTNLSTSPKYDYHDGKTTLVGYEVTHMLAITVKDISMIGEVLDAALKAGANVASGITYSSSIEQETYLEALALAVKNAAAKAESISIAAGVWLGSLSQINEQQTYYQPVAYAAMSRGPMNEADLGSTLMTGELTVEANVELIYTTR